MSELANILLVNRAIIKNEDHILLIQRDSHDSRNAGLWEFPGGKVDNAETLEEGLVREVYEETGLLVHPLLPVVHVESEIIQTGKYEGRLYVALFHTARLLEGVIKLSEEHKAARWVEAGDARQELTVESMMALASFRKLGIT